MLMFALAGYRSIVCTVARYYSTTIPPMHKERKSHIISLLHNLYSFIAYKLNSLNHVVLFLDTNEFRRNQIPYSKVGTPLYVYTILQFLTLFLSLDPSRFMMMKLVSYRSCGKSFILRSDLQAFIFALAGN